MTDAPDFTLLSPDDAAQLVLQLTPADLAAVASIFSPEQLQKSVPWLVADRDSQWQAKLSALLQGLTQRHQLEAIGRTLSPAQMLAITSFCLEGPASWRDKLQFILVGLPQVVFEDILQDIDNEQLRVLKDLGPTESVQHHLTLLVHELSRLAEAYAVDMDELERRIDGYDLRGITQSDFDNFLHQIEDTVHFFHDKLFVLDTALALAWNTTREDLIERLTQLKENWLRYLQFTIGSPGLMGHPATALYAKLEQKMNGIFGTANDPQALTDDDPAIEALATLSLWVLQDYWEVGLLPGICSAAELEPSSAQHSEKLLRIAQDNLNAIGLATVGDLKKAHIYSRNMLIRYIQHHQSALANAKL